MYSMTIRKAKTADLSALVAMDTVTKGLDRRIDDLKAAIVHGKCWVYAEAGAAPAGYAILQSDFYEYPFIRLVFVANDQRRKGIASRLIRHLETVGGADRMFTSANQSNQPMQALMDRLGYQRCGEIHGLDDNDPELVYLKRV